MLVWRPLPSHHSEQRRQQLAVVEKWVASTKTKQLCVRFQQSSFLASSRGVCSPVWTRSFHASAFVPLNRCWGRLCRELFHLAVLELPTEGPEYGLLPCDQRSGQIQERHTLRAVRKGSPPHDEESPIQFRLQLQPEPL